MAFQNIVGKRLAQAAITATPAKIYTTPANVMTYVKDIDVCNTTGGPLTVNIHIVPTGSTAATSNALYYGFSIAANTVLPWRGTQVMNYNDTIWVTGSNTGLTITISGGEAT